MNTPQTGKLIRTRDLKESNIDFSIDLSKVEENQLSRADIRCVSESCLLLATRWRSLKPTYFNFTDTPIFKGNDIQAFKIDETKVDLSYLINELSADYVVKQLDAVRMGTVIPYIRIEDLLEVRIKLPSLEEQRAKVEGAYQAFYQAKINELYHQKEILSIKEDTFNEFASIKHTFRQYLGALKSNVTGTRKFLSKKNGMPISLDDIYSSKLNQTLSDHLFSIEDTISALSKLLETDSHNLNSSKVECFNLKDLVITGHKRLYQDSFEFELEVDQNSFGSFENEIEPFIDINLEDFMNLFSNIVSNAINHGFKDENGNIIRSIISYNSDAELVVLEVSNNGTLWQKSLPLSIS